MPRINPSLALPRTRSLVLVLASIFLVDVISSLVLWKHGLFYRFIEVPSLSSIEPPRAASPFSSFRSQLEAESWFRDSDVRTKYVGTLRWSMDQVTSVEPASVSTDAEALLKAVRSGEGALCDQMSLLYTAGLASLGLPARTVWLYRNLPSRDTHSFVEVPLNGKWVILDPTFGVVYEDGQGGLL